MRALAILSTLTITAVLSVADARADAMHEAMAMALLDDATVMAMSLMPDDNTLIFSKTVEAPGLTCDFTRREFIAYVVDGSVTTTRYGCWHFSGEGFQIKWQDGEVTAVDMADVVVNMRSD